MPSLAERTVHIPGLPELDNARTWRAIWWAALAAAPTWERRYRARACIRHYEAASARVHAAAHAEAAE